MDAALALFSPVSRLAAGIKGSLYRAGVLRPRRAPLAVVSVGNIGFGGSEKTPLVMEILAFLLDRGRKPALVSRGYKGSWEKTWGVLSAGRGLLGGWTEAGDEPFMIARNFPGAGVYIGRDRFLSCRKAREAGFDTAVLDDGFQHLRLARDLDVVLYPAASRLLRESPAALRRAHVILVKKDASSPHSDRIRAALAGKPVLEYAVTAKALVRVPDGASFPPEVLSGKRILAFSGIAGPERFLGLLRRLGADITANLAFRDHYPYPESAIRRILEASRRLQPQAVVTTEKDAVKLMGRQTYFQDLPIHYLKIGLVLEAAFWEILESALLKAAMA